jgi:hypothetical protein
MNPENLYSDAPARKSEVVAETHYDRADFEKNVSDRLKGGFQISPSNTFALTQLTGKQVIVYSAIIVR